MPKSPSTYRPALTHKTNNCTNCAAPTKARRPSKTSEHWCSEPACQAEKQRRLRARAREARQATEAGLPDYELDKARREFINMALHAPRRECPECGLGNAVQGYAHRRARGQRLVCDGVGGAGRDLGIEWIDVVHPERAG